MKKYFKYLNFLSLATGMAVLFSGFFSYQSITNKKFLVLDNPDKPWRFFKQNGSEISLSGIWSLFYAKQVNGLERIRGSYSARFELAQLDLNRISPAKDIAIFLPSAGGLEKVYVNKELVFSATSDSFYDVGPVIPIYSAIEKNSNYLELRIDINSSVHYYVGFKRGPPVLGRMDDLQDLREQRIGFLQSSQLILSGLSLVLTLIIVWLIFYFKNSDVLYRDHANFLFTLTVFFFSLSGIIRSGFPFVGSVLHCPLSMLLSHSLARISLRVASVNRKLIDSALFIYGVLFVLGLWAGLAHHVSIQIVINILARLGFVFSIIVLFLRKKTSFQNSVFFIFVFTGVFYLSDTLRLMFDLGGKYYPFQFTDRYTTQLFLVVPIYFLIYQLVLSLNESMGRRLFEELALQVAHDIRSPLAALEMVSQDFHLLSEETRNLSRGAIDRIKDISNVLLQNHRKHSRDLELNNDPSEKGVPHFIEFLIEAVVSEKRVQYRNRVGLHIYVSIQPNAYGCFAKVNPTEFKRVLSNLINNSAEAVSGAGVISVSLEKLQTRKTALIVVRDSGRGISKEIIPHLFKKGRTFGKKDGSGLGLYHARQMVESWSGQISVETHLEKGTSILIHLPLSEPAPWFVPEIKLSKNTCVIVVDDDQSIHQIWRERLGSLVKKIDHFRLPDELFAWASEADKSNDVLVLCDYELSHHMNGVELLSQFGRMGQSILVTSRFEKQMIELANRFQLKLLPKSMAGFVPIVRV